MTVLTLTALLLLLPYTFASSCLPSCRFHFCTPSRVSLLTPSDRPLYPICKNSDPIGVANTGEAHVQSFTTPFKPISELRLDGLSQSYSPSFFKSYSFQPVPEAQVSFAAVGHEVPQGNQANFLDGRCVVLPIRQYQKIVNGIVVDNVNGGDPFVDCVSFVVGSPDPVVTPHVTPLSSPSPQEPVGPQMPTGPGGGNTHVPKPSPINVIVPEESQEPYESEEPEWTDEGIEWSHEPDSPEYTGEYTEEPYVSPSPEEME